MSKQHQTLAFVSSAYNEAENLVELHRRCREAHAELKREFAEWIELDFGAIKLRGADADVRCSFPSDRGPADGRAQAESAVPNHRHRITTWEQSSMKGRLTVRRRRRKPKRAKCNRDPMRIVKLRSR
jgi:hypothetical protein